MNCYNYLRAMGRFLFYLSVLQPITKGMQYFQGQCFHLNAHWNCKPLEVPITFCVLKQNFI